MNLILLFDGHTFDMEPQGTSTFLAGLVNALPSVAAKHFPNISLKIHCAASDNHNVSSYINVPYTFQCIQTGFLSRNLLGLPRLSRHLKADVMVSQYVRPFWVHKNAVTVIHDLLFIDFPKQFSLKYRISRAILFGISAKFSDLVFTVSEYSKERIAHIYRIDPEIIGILPNAVTSTTKEQILNSDKSKSPHLINLLYVSRLEPRKRYEWCLRAFEDLRLESCDISLTFVGRGSGDYAIALKKLLDQKTTMHGSRLIHLEGISQEDLNLTYANTDVFLFPSIGEGFGIPVIEAAAHGLPCVVTDSTALSELSDYYVGKKFEPENYLQFLNALKDVIDNLPIYKTRAQMNAKKVVDHFSWDTTAYYFLKSIIDLEK